MSLLIKYGYLSLVIAVALFAYGYGYSEANEANKVTQLQRLELANARVNSLNIDLNNARSEIEAEKLRNSKSQQTITKEVIKYVKTPDRNVCNFDTNWLRIRADIIKQANAR